MLALLLAAAVTWALVSGNNDDDPAPKPSATTTQASPSPSRTSQSASPTPSEDADEITINAASFEGRSYNDVEAELINLGLAVNGVGQSSSDFPEGTVIDVNPVGTLQRGTLVTVTYSTGPEPTQSPSMTTVPSGITGQNASAAEQRIKSAGLVPVNGGTQASNQPQGTVVAVNPSEGAPLPEGSTVTYFTSEGPAEVEPAPTNVPEPTPTVTSESTVPAAPCGTNPTAG